MPNDPEYRPPIIDYRPVSVDPRRIPRRVGIFWMGFAVGVLWSLAAIWGCIDFDWPVWVVIVVYPGFAISDSVDVVLFTNGIMYGLLALLGYAVYLQLRRWRGVSGSERL